MRWLSRHMLCAATAALLATSVAAPADARRYRHWDRDDIDFGDVVVGAIIIGGIAVLASEIAKARENNGTVFGGDRRRSNSEAAAVDACVTAAERRARENGRSARVSDVADVERWGDRFRVSGTVDYRLAGGGGRKDQDWRSARFTCGYSHGQVNYVRLDDSYA